VGDQSNSPAALTPEKESPMPIEYKVSWFPEPVRTFRRR